MSRVGGWLLGMQEDAYSLLNTFGPQEARRLFLIHNVGQGHVFDNCLSEMNGEEQQGELR